MQRWVAVLFVLMGGASYGFISPIVKSAYAAGFSVADVTSSQVYVAAVALWIAACFQKSRGARFSRRQIGLLSLLGVAAGLTSIFYYISLQKLPASLGIVLLFQFSWIAMLMDYLLTRRRFTRNRWMGLLMVLIGTWLAVGVSSTSWHHLSVAGVLFGLGSAVSYAVFLYFSERIDVSIGSAPLRSALILTASVVVISAVFPPAFIWNGALSHGLWAWACGIALFAQVVPPLCFTVGIPVTGGAMAAILGSVELPMAVVAARVFLHENVTGWQWIGVLSILVGIAIAERGRTANQVVDG